MENSHAIFEFYWLQAQQQAEENRKYIGNTQLHEEHETNQLKKEHLCDEESEERKGSLIVVKAAKKQVKEDEAKFD